MRRARSEEGFTLVEVLVAMVIGMIVLSATLGLLESSTRLNLGVVAKTEAMQRGRLALDQVTQRLRSQVCLDSETAAVVTGSTANAATFYSDFGTADGKPAIVKTQLAFVPSGGDPKVGAIWEYTYRSATNPPTTFPATPSSSRMILGNVALQADGSVPFLRYYAFEQVAGRPSASKLLATPLTASTAPLVARIDVAFKSRPPTATNNREAIDLGDQVLARHADANETPPANASTTWAPEPECL